MDTDPLMETPRPRTLPDDPKHRAWPAINLGNPRVHLVRGDPPEPGNYGSVVALCGVYVAGVRVDDTASTPCTSCRTEAARLAITWRCCRVHYP